MTDLISKARDWADHDPDPKTRQEILDLIESGDMAELEGRFGTTLTFGTAGIRGKVEGGTARMNRAVVIRTTHGLASHLDGTDGHVVIGYDARPDSRQFAEDAAGVLAAAGIAVLYFPEVAPTPLVAFAAKHLGARAAVVVTASHNPPADNGYKVYGEHSSQIVSPVDTEIQAGIDKAPPADQVPRIESAFDGAHDLVRPVPGDIVDCYWEEVSATRSRTSGSDLKIVYTPIHGVGRDVLLEVMGRAGHENVVAVPGQAEPDGTFPTVDFPNPEEPGALDLALALGEAESADLVIANDPDADRLAVVLPTDDDWRPLTGNEVGVLLGDYMLRNDRDAGSAIVANSIVSSPMLGRVAAGYGARFTQTLTGFKWIVKAGLGLEAEGEGRFIYGYEEALGYSVGTTVRDKDGISAAVLFVDLFADLSDAGQTILDRLSELWATHGLWASAQVSIVRPGAEGMAAMRDAVARLADDPPDRIGDKVVTEVTDYRSGAEGRPPWLGAQALVEMALGNEGRVLVRPSGTEPKLKVYVDLTADLDGDAEQQSEELRDEAERLGETLARELGL